MQAFEREVFDDEVGRSLLLQVGTGSAYNFMKESVFCEDIILDVDKRISVSGLYGEKRVLGFL